MIDQREAQRRRQEITQQADFFGAMDGASKFVRGDAIAGIVIILINIIGGLFIGIVENGMSLGRAGLAVHHADHRRRTGHAGAGVSDLAGGRLAGHAQQPGEQFAERSSCGSSFRVRRRWPWRADFLGVLIFTSLPRIPLLLIGAGCVGMAVTLTRRENKVQAVAEAKKQAEAAKTAPARRGLSGRRSDGNRNGRRA